MRWICSERKNSGAWVAVCAGVWSATQSLHHGHVSGWWTVGVVAGILVGVGVVAMVRRRCV